MSTEPMDDDQMIAAELALGLLEGETLAEARHRRTTDPAFAALVTQWEIQFAALTDDLMPETPAASNKRVVMDRIFAAEPAPGLFERLRLWQAATALSVLLLAFVAFLDRTPAPDSGGPLYTAEIVSEAGDFRVIAVVDKSTGEVIMTRTAGAAPAGRILQIWAHGEGEPAVSVGLWPDGETVRVAMPADIAAVEGILTLGVSEEPPGGSPTGSPSGRVFGTVDIPGVR